jgi:NADPH2:quinone reductase
VRAVVVETYGPLEEAAVRDIPAPRPREGEVAIAVEAAGVNFPDILVMEGNYQVKPELPFTPGKEAAGVVTAVAPDVVGFHPGDRVAAQVEYGAYAQHMVVPACNVYALPDALGFDEAAALGLSYLTAHFALRERARLGAGEKVLVLGASGGVGLAAVQLGRAFGATVIGGTRGEGSARIVVEAGADHVVELGKENLRDALREDVRRATDGYGVDVVIDPVGGEPFAAALRCLAWCGRLVTVGFASGAIPEVRANYLLVKNIAVMGLQWSDYRDRRPDAVRAAQAEIFDLAVGGKLRPHISVSLPLDKFADALTLLRAGVAEGKLVLHP